MKKSIELLNAKSFIIYDKKIKKIIFETNKIYPQHFFPHNIIDYAEMVKKMVKNEKEKLPIMSISSKDFPYCDFDCKDCLAKSSRDWASKNIPCIVPNIQLYKKILYNVSEYSKMLGCSSVRFEICGEGNPDMFPNRDEIIQFAKEKCNMGVVYISTGSKLDYKTKIALSKYVSYIRISFPGIDNLGYDYYSNQKGKKKFKYNDAIELLKELVLLRKKYNRENNLIIGVRTCIRDSNEGKYINFAKQLGKIGVDSLQIVKVLTPEKNKIKDNIINKNLKKELLIITKKYKQYGLKHVQLPIKLDSVYEDRKLKNEIKPSKCYSSIFSPILYGTNLITCTHWDKISDVKNFHYGELKGNEDEISKLMNCSRSLRIRSKIPSGCDDCCSINDNLMFEIIKLKLSLCNDLNDIEFKLK